MTLVRLNGEKSAARLIAVCALLALLSVASRTSALVITGQGYTLPGGGSCSIGGVPSTGTGATVTCTGINLAAHTKVYFGIRNDLNVNGQTMNGSGAPTAGSAAVFRSSSTAASNITYTSTTTISSAIPAFGTDTVTNILSLTRTAGTATVVPTGGTPANNSFADIGHLYQITAGTTLTLDVDVGGSDPHFSGPNAAPNLYDPTHATAGAGGDNSKVDVNFYWSDCGDGVVDSPEQCDLGAGNGLSTTCCTSTCTFRASGQTCRPAAPDCDVAETCSGVAATCPADVVAPAGAPCTDDGNGCTNDVCSGGVALCTHPSQPLGFPCVGNGVSECTNADSCDGAGSCLNNDVAAGTQCNDIAPPTSGNCEDAQCDGAGTCDQTFGNEPDGTACNDLIFCNGADQCNSGTCSTHAGDPCPGPDGDANCAESCSEVNSDCTNNDPDGSACSDGLFCTGAETCTTGTCGGSSGDPCPGPNGDLDCSESCNEAGDDCTADDPDGTLCRADAGECDVQETCLTGSCPADGFEASGFPCGSGSNTDCTNPDTCDGAGSCQVNDEVSGTSCGDPSDTTCTNPDTCDGAGMCLDNHEPNTVICRPPTGGACDAVENCDGAGNCPADGVLPNGTPCRADTGECDVPEACDGVAFTCPTDGFEPSGTTCGDPTNTDCDNPDTCDGANACVDNLEPSGASCGDPANTDCDNPDTCDGSGSCEDNLENSGTPCGNPTNTDCTHPDTCDGIGACQVNHEPDGTSCFDGSLCTTGELCSMGICTGGVGDCPLEHYKCYQGKDLKNPKFTKLAGVQTADQIGTQPVDVKKLKFVCNPVSKNGSQIFDPNAHLVCYQVKAANLAPRPIVEVSTQFQTSQFQLKKGKLVCLPGTKTILP